MPDAELVAAAVPTTVITAAGGVSLGVPGSVVFAAHDASSSTARVAALRLEKDERLVLTPEIT